MIGLAVHCCWLVAVAVIVVIAAGETEAATAGVEAEAGAGAKCCSAAIVATAGNCIKQSSPTTFWSWLSSLEVFIVLLIETGFE